MIYKHKFETRSTLPNVREFHMKSRNMAEITPPPVIVSIHSAPQTLGEADEMKFTLWLLFLPIRWLSRIEDVAPNGFVDRQIHGPFKSWSHKHSYHERNSELIDVIDEVEAELSSNPFWWLVGAGMWISLPLLFTYRAWKTKRLLEK
jgi:ligand-binding SRPBCC domain-containing protein